MGLVGMNRSNGFGWNVRFELIGTLLAFMEIFGGKATSILHTPKEQEGKYREAGTRVGELFCPFHGIPAVIGWVFLNGDPSFFFFTIRYSCDRMIQTVRNLHGKQRPR